VFYRGNKIWVRVRCVWIKSRVRYCICYFRSNTVSCMLWETTFCLLNGAAVIPI